VYFIVSCCYGSVSDQLGPSAFNKFDLIYLPVFVSVNQFLADLTNGGAYATVLRPSSSVVVCNCD